MGLKAGGQGVAKAAPVGTPGPRPSPGNRKLSFKDQRDFDRLPGEVQRLEGEIAEAEAALHDPDLFLKHPDKFAALTKSIDLKRAEKDAAEERWLQVAELAEAIGR